MFKKILALALVLSMALFMVPAQAEEAESTFPAIAKEDLKIGMIYVGDTSDGGYNYVHDSALMQAVKELGMNEDQVVKKTNVPEDATCETALRELVEAGCQIIFADSFGHMYYMEPIAEEYPNVIFSHCSGYINNGVNMNNYFGRIYEPRFLSGLAAGLRTQTNKIGYVSAMNNPECNGGLDAFTLGVRTVNPDATVYVYEDNGSVQGFIGLTKNYIEGIFVEESMRGKGIGTQLLNLAKQLCSSLTLQVYEKNQSALRFYFKEGFQIKKKQMDSETGQMDFTMEWSM